MQDPRARGWTASVDGMTDAEQELQEYGHYDHFEEDEPGEFEQLTEENTDYGYDHSDCIVCQEMACSR